LGLIRHILRLKTNDSIYSHFSALCNSLRVKGLKENYESSQSTLLASLGINDGVDSISAILRIP
jgi:hypothetical protein